ncbi:hypothetical protein H8E88_00150 [candidate division KSB1 bacterium]|nr:hypothetical protein [candidate division KSB1 bacterium]
MKKFLILFCAVAFICFAGNALAGPFPVGPTPKETNWTSWGYVVDNQTWANWFAVEIPYGSVASMSGTYTIVQDLLFLVDPNTSGLTDPASVYGANFWNHDGIYGLGEFFDAGLGAKYQIIWLICLIGNKVIQMIKTNSLKPIHQP